MQPTTPRPTTPRLQGRKSPQAPYDTVHGDFLSDMPSGRTPTIREVYTGANRPFQSFDKMRKAQRKEPQRDDSWEALKDHLSTLDERLNQIQMPAVAPDYNISAGYEKARRKAAKAQNPVYERKINQYMKEFERQRKQARTGAQQGRQELRTGLEQTKEDIARSRQREQEDFSTDIEQQTQEQRTTERVGGREFNRDRRDIQEDVAARNMATSGLGRQEVAEAEEDRATQVQRVEQNFENKEAARERLRDRTLEDLMTRGKRKEQATERGIEKIDVNLESELERIKNQQRQRKFQTEQERLSAINEDQQRIYQRQVANWVNNISDPRRRQAARRAYL